jgi:protein-disulfide isomerase
MTLPRRATKDLKVLLTSPIAIALTVLFVGGAVSTLAFFPREVAAPEPGAAAPALPAVAQDQRTELERFMATAPRVPLVIPSGGAKVLIVKFADYQCPVCGQAYLSYKPILAKYESLHPGQVRVVLKDYPLDPDCNNNLTTMMHPSACDAAVAVRLARQHNRGDQMEEWLYTHQEQMTPQSVRDAARDVGQVPDFDAKYASALESVKSDIALGRELHVTATPTFFVNGVKIDGAWAPQFFDQVIAYELAHAK